jgi:hypothetical protein
VKYFITLVLILMAPCFASGASVTFSWNVPTTSCDGSTLDDLSGYAIMWGTSPGGPYVNQHNVSNPQATSTTVNVGPAENVTLYFIAVSVDTSGNRSDDSGGCGTSNEVAVSFSSLAPSPPTNFRGVPAP